MKAVVYKDAFSVAVEEVPDPRIEDPRDVIVKITSTNICGSDLHMYEGRTNVEQGKVLGHENMGVVAETGSAVMDWLGQSVRATGRLGVVGVYVPQDPGAATEGAKDGRIGFDFGKLFQKGLSMGTGQCPVKRYNEQLRDLIIAGRATPSAIVSHELPLAQAPSAYEKFDKREDGYTKVILHPAA